MTEQATVIRWEKPPPSRRQGSGRGPGGRYDAVADQLRDNPGCWAVIAENVPPGRSALACHIRKGAISAFGPAGDFDAVARRLGDVYTIYARYVGDEVEA